MQGQPLTTGSSWHDIKFISVALTALRHHSRYGMLSWGRPIVWRIALNKLATLLCVIGGALFVSCRSVPAQAAAPPELLANIADLLVRVPDMRAEMLSRHYHESITAADYDRYVIIKWTMDYYNGGAHGMYGTEYRVFDRDSGRFVTLQDVFDADKRETLHKAVVESLRKKFELAEDQGLTDAGFFSDELALTENFFLSGEGVGFHWNIYELAPYVFGEIEVVVPHESRQRNYSQP
jgi:hypothetical protein